LRDRPEDPSLIEINRQIVGLREEIGNLTNELINSDAGLSFFGSSDGNVSNRFVNLRNEVLLLEVERQQLEAQRDLLEERAAEYRAFFEDLPDNMIEMARYRRNMEINEQLFLLISQQAAETALWEQTQSGLASIVDMSFIPDRSCRTAEIDYTINWFGTWWGYFGRIRSGA
jgi:uncharacterized protein involved in exopolysaccharide biosynthesis